MRLIWKPFSKKNWFSGDICRQYVYIYSHIYIYTRRKWSANKFKKKPLIIWIHFDIKICKKKKTLTVSLMIFMTEIKVCKHDFDQNRFLAYCEQSFYDGDIILKMLLYCCCYSYWGSFRIQVPLGLLNQILVSLHHVYDWDYCCTWNK